MIIPAMARTRTTRVMTTPAMMEVVLLLEEEVEVEEGDVVRLWLGRVGAAVVTAIWWIRVSMRRGLYVEKMKEAIGVLVMWLARQKENGRFQWGDASVKSR
jgi:hypothetical protein